MVRNRHYIVRFPPADIFQHFFRSLIHCIDDSIVFIIDDEKIIFLFVTLLDKAYNIDPASNTWHKFGYNVALYYMTF